MAEFNGLTKQQEDEMIERIMQDKPWEGFFNRAWFRFFRNHMLKITLLFYIPVMNKIIPDYSTMIMGILFILAIAIEYRTKRIEDKITDRQWVEVAMREGKIGNPPAYEYLPLGFKRTLAFYKYHKWILILNIVSFVIFYIVETYEIIEHSHSHQRLGVIFLSLLTIFYISYPSVNFVWTDYFERIRKQHGHGVILTDYLLKENGFIGNFGMVIHARLLWMCAYFGFSYMLLSPLMFKDELYNFWVCCFVYSGFIFAFRGKKYSLFQHSQINNFY